MSLIELTMVFEDHPSKLPKMIRKNKMKELQKLKMQRKMKIQKTMMVMETATKALMKLHRRENENMN